MQKMVPPTSADQPALTSRRKIFREVRNPRQVFSHLTPNWFASVMGTGIVANATVTLPLRSPLLDVFAVGMWLLACGLLVLLIFATFLHWVWFRKTATSHIFDPVVAQFYGAPAMALLTVGAGAILFGPTLMGTPTAISLSVTLWVCGTSLGLLSAVTLPYLMFTRYKISQNSAFGGWLMPVVPPMVSAASGALLIPYVPEGQLRLDMLLACYAMFGISLFASMIVITMIWSRLTHYKLEAAGMIPTLWIILGPLGQSITATNSLGGNAHLAISDKASTAFEMFGIIYGIPAFGFAMLWMAIAITITVHTARSGMPFTLTWWSFTFPVGTCVTGVSGLALHTGSTALSVFAVLLFIALVLAWILVATRTFHGSVIKGTLLLKPVAT